MKPTRPASACVPTSNTSQSRASKVPRVASAGSRRGGPLLAPHPPTQPPSGRACMTRHTAWKSSNNAGDAPPNIPQPASSAYLKPVLQAPEALYDHNGIRLDRTPTDDEINWLWDKVRTCLNRESQVNLNSSQVNFGSGVAKQTQPAQVFHQNIDGNTLAPQFGVSARISSAHSHTQPTTNGYMPRKVSADSLNSYTKRMSLLQQRKQQSQHSAVSAHKPSNHTVTTTYQPVNNDSNIITPSHVGPTPSSVAPTPSIATAPQDHDGELYSKILFPLNTLLCIHCKQQYLSLITLLVVSASMAAFLTAEALSKHSVADSDIEQAMDQAQHNQHLFSTARQTAKGKFNNLLVLQLYRNVKCCV